MPITRSGFQHVTRSQSLNPTTHDSSILDFSVIPSSNPSSSLPSIPMDMTTPRKLAPWGRTKVKLEPTVPLDLLNLKQAKIENENSQMQQILQQRELQLNNQFLKGKITESEYDNSMDQVISKLKTLFDDIDQLKMDMLHLHNENKLNNNAITSIKMNMNAVNDKNEDQERE